MCSLLEANQARRTVRRHDCGNKGKAETFRPPWTIALLDSFLGDLPELHANVAGENRGWRTQ
jgi:hypothetical protein